MTTKQASAFHETLLNSAGTTASAAAVHWVLDPLGSGHYVAATRGSDGLDEAWLVPDISGVLQVDDASAGARVSPFFASSSTVLV